MEQNERAIEGGVVGPELEEEDGDTRDLDVLRLRPFVSFSATTPLHRVTFAPMGNPAGGEGRAGAGASVDF